MLRDLCWHGQRGLRTNSLRLVLIEWVDSYGASSDWDFIENPQPKPLVCRSAGWLAYDGEDCKLIVPHLSSSTHEDCKPQGCGDMTIPSRSVVSITELSPKLDTIPLAVHPTRKPLISLAE